MERLKIIGEIVLGEKGFFSINKISERTGVSADDVRVVLDRLFRERLLLRFKIEPRFASLRGRPGARFLYQKKNKAKFLNKVAPRLKEDTAQDRMWKIIRDRESFKVVDLIVLAEVKRENARWFVKMLRRAGYIRPSKPGGPGVEWTLIKDAGPKRPYVTARKVRG